MAVTAFLWHLATRWWDKIMDDVRVAAKVYPINQSPLGLRSLSWLQHDPSLYLNFINTYSFSLHSKQWFGAHVWWFPSVFLVCAQVRRLVAKGEVDVYIAATNYRVPAGQEQRLCRALQRAGCKQVLVVGRETLTRYKTIPSQTIISNYARLLVKVSPSRVEPVSNTLRDHLSTWTTFRALSGDLYWYDQLRSPLVP